MKSAGSSLIISLFITIGLFGFAQVGLASSGLAVHIANNNLYIDTCSSNIQSITGYKGYVGNTEIFTTGPLGGYACFSGDLFISNLSSYYAAYTSTPFTSHFDFYLTPDFSDQAFASFTLSYDGSSFSVLDTSTHVISFDVSTSTNTASIHDYINQSDVGSTISFSISSSTSESALYISSPVYSTTSGDFYYSWQYPALITNNDYIFSTNVASTTNSNTTILTSTSTTVSLLTPITGDSNVLFIPGLEASRLYEQKTVLGVSVEDQLWEPNTFLDMSDLYLNNSGVSIKNVYTKDILDNFNIFGTGAKSIYQSIIQNLNMEVTSGKINQWIPYAYDWRQGVQDIVDNGTQYQGTTTSLINTLQSLVNTSKNAKVTIIAHSNGGLIAKALVKKLEDMKSSEQNNLIDHLDNIIMVASPQVGTPDAISSVLDGYKDSILKGLILSETQARTLAINMPGAYGLLPSTIYFNQQGIIDPVSFSSSTFTKKYGSGINSYQEEHNFIIGAEGRTNQNDNLFFPLVGNANILTQAENLHAVIDNMTFPVSINIIDIAGWGKDTIGGMTYSDDDLQPVFTDNGDGTVISQSALFGSGTKYWLDLTNSKLDHASIMEDPQILSFIDSIIEQATSTSYLSANKPFEVTNRLHLSVHSPVSIGVYDSQGNFTGKVCDDATGNCTIQENIPGSTYYEFGEGKYVNLGEGNVQKVILQGTDSGTFTLDSQIVFPNGQATTSSFVDIPVTTQTQAEITVNQTTGIPTLKLDVTGDGVTDFILAPNSTFDPITYLQIMKATVDSLDITDAKKKVFDTRVNNIITSIQKGKIDKAKLKVDRFKTVLENKLAKPDPKKPKAKKLSKTDAQTLLDMLNQLLDNIG